jgi:hypothetical protein
MEKLRRAHRPEPEVEPLMSAPSGVGPEAGTVHVSSGAMSESFELVGLTVEQARSMLGRAYNLDPNAEATVNEVEALPGQRLQAGDSLDFGRLLGEKGGT